MPYKDTIVPLYLDTDTSDSQLQKGAYRAMYNARTLSAEEKGAMEAARGNTLLPAATAVTPSGKNKVIGTVSDDSQLVLLLWNVNSKHSVLRFKAGKWEKIIENPFFFFKEDVLATSISLSGNILTFTYPSSDGRYPQGEPFSVDMETVKGRTLTREHFYLLKMPPTAPLKVIKAHKETRRALVGRDSWQFSWRYIYQGGEVSVLAPFSDLIPADLYYNESAHLNSIKVTYTVPADKAFLLDRIELFYRKGNRQTWYRFHTAYNPATGSKDIYFYGDEIASPISDEEAYRPHEAIPRARAHAHFKGFHFFGWLTFGHDMAGMNPLLSVTTISSTDISQVAKPGAMYTVGLELFDRLMRSVGIVKTQQVSVPWKLSNATGYSQINKDKVKVTCDVQLPDWVGYARLAVSRDRYATIFMQVPVNYLFYTGEYLDEDAFAMPAGMTAMDGKLFLTDLPDSRTDFQHLYLQIPQNAGLEIDTSMMVRVISPDIPSNREEAVIEVIGDYVVVDSFGIGDFRTLPATFLVEFYRPRTQEDPILYSTGETYTVQTSGRLTINATLKGDAYVVGASDSRKFIFRRMLKGRSSYADINYTRVDERTAWIYSPTPQFTNRLATTEVAVEQELAGIRLDNPKWYQFWKQPQGVPQFQETYKARAGYTLDYTGVAASYGKPTVRIFDQRQREESVSVAWTGRRNNAGALNLLSTMNADDRQSVGVSYSPIRMLIPAGQVLLCIHENTVTSLYIQEGILRAGEESLTAKTPDIIGDDRELQGGFGTIHTESVQEFEGHVYFFDSRRGAVLRYSRAGIERISRFGKDQDFKRKKDIYEGLPVIAGIDPYYRQYFLTFPPTGIYPAETICFHIDSNHWEGSFEYVQKEIFLPQGYARLSSRLFSFLEGEVWEHNVGDYLSFYGESKQRKLVIPYTPQPGSVMRYFALHCKAETLGEDQATDEEALFTITAPDGQKTYISKVTLEKEDGIYKSVIHRDVNTPGLEIGKAYFDGEQIRGERIKLTMESKHLAADPLYYLTLLFING